MTMTDAELAEIRARADKATPGPWRYYPGFDPDEAGSVESDTTWICGIAPEADGTDAFFIARARQDIPALLDELAAARKLLGEFAEHGSGHCGSYPHCGHIACEIGAGREQRARAYLHSATEDADDRTT